MKSLYVFVIVVGLFAFSCDETEMEPSVGYKKMEERLLEYVTFEQQEKLEVLTEKLAASIKDNMLKNEL